jgi:hypothetical protein
MEEEENCDNHRHFQENHLTASRPFEIHTAVV